MKKLPVVGLSCLLLAFVACDGSDEPSDTGGAGGTSGSSGGKGGKAGSGGKAGGTGKAGAAGSSAGSAGESAGSGSGGESGADAGGSGGGDSGSGGQSEGGSGGAGECQTGGEGDVVVEITGLPEDVAADVTLELDGASEELTESATLEGLDTGAYTVVAGRVVDADAIVRTVYDPEVTSSGFCLEDGDEHTVTIAYRAIPTSNKLWTSNLRGFSSEVLAVTGASAPSVIGQAPIGKDIAFDRDGNIWSLGATLAETMIVRVPADGSSAELFDREINVPEIECIPALSALAFDAAGSLWLGACGGNVLELPASELTSGDAESATVFSGLGAVSDLAFDGAGNLWVAADGLILRYDASRLATSSTDAADRTITARDSEDSRDLGATGLAFDADGDLWGFDFGSNFIFEISAANLAGTGSAPVVSAVSFVVGVTSLLDRGAFDEGGGLWISYAVDGIARLSPTQLTLSAGSGAPVTPERIITTDELDSGLRVGLFPAPESLPLYHTAFAD